MMNIFEHQDYKKFFNSFVQSLPKSGRGEYRRVAEKLNVSTTMISQVFNGDKHLNLELASELCDYLNLSEAETDYFFLLVDLARAGTHKLQQKLLRKIKGVQAEMQKLESRLKKDKELASETKQIYYSNSYYTAIRNLVAIPEINDVQVIADRLHIPRAYAQKVLDFLIKEGLVFSKNNKLEVGAIRTHVGADSPLVSRHHQNWRLQGFSKMAFPNDNRLFYTGPMSLSEDVAERIRHELPAFIEKINKWVIPSDSEVVRCLNIDWFDF